MQFDVQAAVASVPPAAVWVPRARQHVFTLIVGAILLQSYAVDRSKFRTCEQGSFCRRYKKYITRIDGSGSYSHALDTESLHHNGHVVSGKLLHVNDASVQPLALQLRWFKDAFEGKCGILQIFITEEAPLHPRFRLAPGDVVLKDSELIPDEVTLQAAGDDQSRIVSSAPGDCQVTLRHRPFELELSAGGRVLQRLNGRHLLNFESYRSKSAPAHAGLVDATDVDDSQLWEESFAGHSDSKPRGPAAVGVDVTFQSAVELVGLAEHAAGLSLAKNGFSEPYRFYNLDVFEYEIDVPMALYGAIPLVTAVHRWPEDTGSTSSGFFFANPSEGHVKVDGPTGEGLLGLGGGDKSTKTWWVFESGVLDAFMFAGPTPQAVLQQYHTVTGMPRLPPLCTLGKHQSRWNYVDIEDSVGVNANFDKHDIPYDVLWLDIEHTDGKKYFTWHPTHFGKPDVLLDALKESKRKLVTIIDPHIKKDEGYDVFTKLRDMDFYTKTAHGKQYDGWCWPGTSYYPDFCNPAMRDQWAKFFALDYYPHNRPDLYTWNDMNEPSVFNGPEVTMPRDNLHKCHTESYGVEHRDVHNVYGFYHHGASIQGQLERAPNVRPFILTRSFFAGTHRHSAVWTGDNMARWNHLSRSVPMLVSLCLCGMSFAGADVPGFFFDAEPELFRRWHQLGIWYPFYRGHAHLETKRREPWLFGEEITSMIREQVTVRYQLLPTWYTLFAEWAMAGLPILRPLWYHDLDDATSFNHANDHFLVGGGILVRAVTEAGMTKADTYLPKGQWYDFWDQSAAPLEGGKSHSLKLADGHLPVFVRSGQIIFKRMRRRRSAGAMANDPYTIVIYGPTAKGRLYIDDGETHEYKSGTYVYDAFEFDGVALSEKTAPGWPGTPTGKGLQNAQQRQLRVERVTFLGLPRKPLGAKLVHASGQTDEVQITSEPAASGEAWTATVKKPTGLIGGVWSLHLVF